MEKKQKVGLVYILIVLVERAKRHADVVIAKVKNLNCFPITTPAVNFLLQQGNSNAPSEMSKDQKEMLEHEKWDYLLIDLVDKSDRRM